MESLQSLEVSWLVIGSFAVTLAFLLMLCDMEHFIPRWSLRLFLLAVALQALGIGLGAQSVLKLAQLVSATGIIWILFGLIQDISIHLKNHQH